MWKTCTCQHWPIYLANVLATIIAGYTTQKSTAVYPYFSIMPNRCYTTVYIAIWSPIKWPVHYDNSAIAPNNLAIAPINSASLTAERCYSAFTHLCTSAIVMKQEQMLSSYQ